jgi:hypothetical protein
VHIKSAIPPHTFIDTESKDGEEINSHEFVAEEEGGVQLLKEMPPMLDTQLGCSRRAGRVI